VALSSAAATGVVAIGAIERLCDPAPTPGGGMEYRSIETVVEFRVARRAPANFLTLGRIRRGTPTGC